MMKYFLGLDNGGTTTKAALYDRNGQELGVACADTEILTPHPGFYERDMEEMWRTNCCVIRKILDETGVFPGDIKGIAVCGHGKGLYLWGKDNRPLRNGILSTDNRAWKYPQKWHASGVEKNVFLKTYQQIIPCQAVSLLAWLQEHEPETIAGIKWIFECKDYIRFRLTGKAMGERTDYSGANLLNLNTKEYDRELMTLFGLKDLYDALPPLCNATDLCGSIIAEAAEETGLAPRTPVAGGMFDIDACAVAVGAFQEDRLCMIAGTWSINEYVRRDPVLDGTVSLHSIFCNPDYFLIEESSATSAGNHEWIINNLLPELKALHKGTLYQVIDDMIDQIDTDEFCPVFTPFLMGSNVHQNAKASFVGISSFHRRAHLLRAVYEGIVFSHRTHFERLMKTRTAPFACIRLAGGAAKSAVWAQMFADVMGIPVETADIGETGALGSAITAAVACGVYKSYEEAAGRMVRPGDRFIPNENNFQRYQEKYRLYQAVNRSLDPVWDQMQEMIDRKHR